ncbi:MAG: DUF2029 domain-containing protein [Flavobacteriales bacterium]|jgi:alpha-1,2-mannosyltransferase|nr:DUF2029 domain-containing protein [Flavobacteriales bacterium]
MTQKRYTLLNSILILIGIILLYEVVRNSMRDGDFVGYVLAGNDVLNGQYLYGSYLNTWPPLFSIFSVVLALGDKFSPFFIRFIWLSGSVISIYFIVAETVKLIFKKSLSLRPRGHHVLPQDPIILIPLLIILRFVLDNLANLQINIFLLLGAILSIRFFIEKKYVWVGLLLGLTISLKVYPIFILFYFLYKREFKPVLWTFLFIVVLNSVSFLVFGFEQAIFYYQHWASEVAPKSYIANHKNQSLFGMFLRLYTSEDPGHDLHVNILSLKPYSTKVLTYGFILISSLVPAYLFRKRFQDRSDLCALLQYSILFTAIPLLSPISWKAYFVFQWVPYFLLYTILFRSRTKLPTRTLWFMKVAFGLSVVLHIGSAEIIAGRYFSDVLEAYSAITIGSIVLLLVQLYAFVQLKKFDLETVHLQSVTRHEV